MNKLVVANLKMNLVSPGDRERYVSNFKKEMGGREFSRTKVVLCPPYVHLEYFRKELEGEAEIGAQNMFFEREGSFTGEVSGAMIKNIGCGWVILGHSERRRYFGETDSFVAKKINSALKLGLKVILCVGEKNQSVGGAAVVIGQLGEYLKEVGPAKIENIVFCYEPVWAISSNNPNRVPGPNEIMSSRILIRKFLVEKYGKKLADKAKIIYGGSVDAKNVRDVCVESAMDGALVGKESLIPYDFLKIVEIINE